jgi:hypothetical protein
MRAQERIAGGRWGGRHWPQAEIPEFGQNSPKGEMRIDFARPRECARLIWLNTKRSVARDHVREIYSWMQSMSLGEMAFLGLVILAFTTFGLTLAWANWYERSWAAKQAEKRRRPDQPYEDQDWRQAA